MHIVCRAIKSRFRFIQFRRNIPMSKRIIALVLCVLMLVPALASCSQVNEDNPGAYVTMYLSDEIYDFDPIQAYYNSGTSNVIGLMYETLFKLDEKGRVKKALAKDYEIIDDTETDTYEMTITLHETCWSNGQAITAEDVVFAWRRLLNQENSYEAATLLFDIKNARAVKEGDEAIDDLGVEALEPTVLKITFQGRIDYDQFILNLTSLATAPLPESQVAKNPDWAKKASTIVTSGPFKLSKIKYATGDEKVRDDNAIGKDGQAGSKTTPVMTVEYFCLERNIYYYREADDRLDKSVTPYRLLIDCTMTDQEILKAYKANKLFYIGDIPLSIRKDATVKENVQISNALSTTVCYFNMNNEDEKLAELFSNAKVREALSLAIDRKAIAKKVVYAEAATGLVPPGVFNAESGKKAAQFREEGGNLISTSANKTKAKQLLDDAGITPSKYSFELSVATYDDVHLAIAEMIVAAWKDLGFKVTIKKIQPVQNNDYLKSQDEEPKDVCDDLFQETIARAKYDVVLCDYTAYSADAFSMLACFAKPFSGMALNRYTVTDDETGKSHVYYEQTANRTGYENEAYDLLIEAAYFVPYFKSLKNTSNEFLGDDFYTADEWKALYADLKSVYNKYNITPSNDPDDWAAQRAKLLHAAEKLLVKDMALVPIVFNQTAVLVSKDLKKIDANYYSPMVFTKLKLKNYTDYTYTVITRNEKGEITNEETVSIFENFPKIEWNKIGTTVEKKATK